MYLIRLIQFYNNRKRRLVELVGKKNSKLLLKAISHDLTIYITEKNAKNPIDGELYNVLKGLGAKSVKNSYIVLENEGSIEGTYITYFNETNSYQSQRFEKTSKADRGGENNAGIKKASRTA